MRTKPLTMDYLRSRTTETPDGCWEWTGFRHKTGYGELRRNGKRILAHRLAYFLTHGEWPNICRHTCDNRPCVNPDHLLDGTHADNAQDRSERDRCSRPTGYAAHRAVLTPERVAEARELRALGWTQQKIANRIGCSQGTVSRLLLGHTYCD